MAVAEAHAAGLTIACHANDPESCRIAARAGVDSLEHGMFLDADDLAAMAANGTVLVPTLSVWDAWLFYGREVGWPAARLARAEGLRESSRAAIAGAVRAGVPIAAGTDAGGGSVRHGRIAREIELMIECGMEPAAALQAATAGRRPPAGRGGDARHHRTRQDRRPAAARPQPAGRPGGAAPGRRRLPGRAGGSLSTSGSHFGGNGGQLCSKGSQSRVTNRLPISMWNWSPSV